ncbi:hypothetical protein D3C76_1506420 [compost metagenome]
MSPYFLCYSKNVNKIDKTMGVGIMTTFKNTDDISKNLLQFCYTCEDAHLCTTEEKCRACWTEQGLLADQDELDETQRFLQLMHA